MSQHVLFKLCLLLLLQFSQHPFGQAAKLPTTKLPPTKLPPTSLPPTFNTWVVTSISDLTQKPPILVSSKGQNIVFDSTINNILNASFSCRYRQELLKPVTKITNIQDQCIYETFAGGTVHLQDNTTNVRNTSQCVYTPIEGPLSILNFPNGFFTGAVYYGQDSVNSLLCDHWSSRFPYKNKWIVMDTWFADEIACQISMTIANATSNEQLINWAFDGFQTRITDDAIKNCSLVCATDKHCYVRKGADTKALQSALDYACGKIDCTPIQPGGTHYLPNTQIAHCDWAFDTYFLMYVASQGPGCCNFGGTAILTTGQQPTLTKPKPFKQFAEDYPLLTPNLVCEDATPLF